MLRLKGYTNPGQAAPGSSDVSLFKSIRTRHAEFKRALLVVDAGARTAKRIVSPLSNMEMTGSLNCAGLVFHKFADDHEREVTALFLHGAMDGVGHIFQVRTYIRLFDYDDARCGQHVVFVHRDSRRVCRLRPLRRPRSGAATVGFLYWRCSREVGVVRSRIAGIHKWVEVF